jgi:hypothetical protein
MRPAFAAAISTFLAALAVSLATPSAQTPINLTGTWHGTATDFWVDRSIADGMTVTWVLTHTGSTVSGTVTSRNLIPNDGSCSSCHRVKSGTVTGTVSGATLTLTMSFPGRDGEITPHCSSSFTGTVATLAQATFTMSYAGHDSCEGPFSNGTLPLTREAEVLPSISVQPASQLIVAGQPVTLSVTAGGSAPISYQWYLGTSGSPSEPIAGAILASYVTPSITTASRYWARVSTAYGRTLDSDTATLTPYRPFTDNVLTAGVSIIQVAHITELRSRVDAVRARFGLAAFVYADATLTAGTSGVRAQHLVDLRAALADAYTAAGRGSPAYTDAGLGPGMLVRRAHVTELRAAVALIE